MPRLKLSRLIFSIVLALSFAPASFAQQTIAPTCVAHYAKDVSTRLVADRRFPHGARPYTVREYARLQGVPDAFTFAGSDNDAYRMIGNGVSVPVGKWIGSEIVRYFR